MSETAAAPKKAKMTGRHFGLWLTCALMGGIVTALWCNCVGIFYTPVAKDLGVGLGTLTIYSAIGYIGAGLLLPVCGNLLNKGNARYLYLFAALAVVASWLLMSFANQVWMFYIAGIGGAFMMAFMLYLMPTLMAKWFSARIGFFTSAASMFSGIGAAIWNIVIVNVITGPGWRTAYLVCAAIVVVVMVPMILIFVRSTPMDIGLRPYGEELVASGDGEKKVARLTGADYAKVMKSPVVVLFAIQGFCGGCFAAVCFYLPSYAYFIGYPALIGAALSSAAMIGNLVGKLVFGSITDKSPLIGVACGVFFPIIGVITIMALGAADAVFVIAACFIVGLCNPNAVLLLPLAVKKSVGDKDFTLIQSRISTVAAFAAGIGSTMWGFIFDFTGSYDAVFVGGMCILVVLFCCYLGARKTAKNIAWTEETDEQYNTRIEAAEARAKASAARLAAK